MPKKLTEEQKNIVIKSLASGATRRQAGKAGKVSHAINESLITESDIIKKKVHNKIVDELVQDNKDIIDGLYRIQRDAITALTADKIGKQSGAAIATTLAIACDKAQLLTGGATENVNISTGEKSKLIDFAMRKESANNKHKTDNNIPEISESRKRIVKSIICVK
jgi:hypothetical protein